MERLKRLGLATRNINKVREIETLLLHCGFKTEILHAGHLTVPEPEETGTSFMENAVLKALYYEHYFQIPTLADDSGLVIPALGGAPGLHSARWGHPAMKQWEKNLAIIQQLHGSPEDKRHAYFHCAAAFAKNGRIIWSHEDRVRGIILPEPRGSGGFGYDPIFFYPPLRKTFAELSSEEKNRVSHRGKVLSAWLAWLKQETHDP